MPKYYCDYCDIFLTHDSVSVRKAHNSGWKHINQVAAYYRNLPTDKIQSIITDIKAAYQGHPNPPELLNDVSSIYQNSNSRYHSYGGNGRNTNGGMRRGGGGRRFAGGGGQRSSSPYSRSHGRGPGGGGQFASEYGGGERYAGGRPRYPPSAAPTTHHGSGGPAFAGAPPADRGDRERDGREYRDRDRDRDRSGRASNWDR